MSIEFIKNKYNYLCSNPCDINEHLPTLYKYASECETVLETGVGDCISSWALCYGLFNNNKQNKNLYLNDIKVCDINELLHHTNGTDVKVYYNLINNLELSLQEKVDLTFIDTWHVIWSVKKRIG